MQTSGLYQPALIFASDGAVESDARTRRITSAFLTALIVLAASLCVVLLVWVPSWPITFWTNVGTAVSCALALALVRHNRTRAAGALAFLTVSLLIAVDSLNPGRAFGLAAPIVPVLLTFIAFLFGRRGLMAAAVFSIVWLLAVVLIKNALWLDRPAPQLRMQLIEASAYVLYVAVTASVIMAASHIVRQAQQSARASALALAQHARDLETEMTERRRLEVEQDRRARELSKLLEISNTLTATLELHRVFDLILHRLKDVVDYDETFIGEFIIDSDAVQTHGDAQSDLRITSAVGGHADALKGQRWRIELPRDLAINMVSTSRRPLVITNLASDDEYTRSFRTWFVANAGAPKTPMAAAMVVPLVAMGNMIGLMVLCTARKGLYDVRLADMALAFANQAAIAAENARLHNEAVRGAAINERARLARDLHDSVSQSLYGIVLGARTALAGGDEPGRVSSALEYVLTLAESGLLEMRALIRELRPEQLQEGSLGVVLKRQVEAMCARHNIALIADLLEEEPELPPQVKEDTYRIAIEAANNAIRHANATRIEVTISRQDAFLVLEVRDNGRGFNTDSKFEGHYGLHGMYERAAAMHAKLALNSAQDVGTTVRLQIPLQ